MVLTKIMQTKLFFTILPYVLRAFGLSKETWHKAVQAAKEVQAEKDKTEGYYNSVHAWNVRIATDVKSNMKDSTFWVNCIRELSVLFTRWKGGMLLLCAFGFATFSCSCTVVHGDANKGTYTLATLGGDLTEMAQTPQGYTVSNMDNSKSFKEASSALKNYVWSGAFKSVASTAGKAWSGVEESKQVTARTDITQKGLTDRAGIEAAKVSTTNFAQ